VNAPDFFAPNYGVARSKFLAAATAAGAVQQHFFNDRATGPNGEPLYTDVARLGPAAPRRLLLLNSATHGVEGYCGSACQIAVLATGLAQNLPDDCALVLSHALNPYGFANDRRVTEDNVDLNRNFVDHDQPPPDPADYTLLHPALLPDEWEGADKARSDALVARYQAERGMAAFQHHVMAGQYSYADGLFFGGRKPSWSNQVWRRIVRDHCADARQIAFIDFHTGLGPSGVGEAIFLGSDEAMLKRAVDWYGEVTSTARGTSSSAQVRGDLACAFDQFREQAEITPIALEFGTVSLIDMIEAVRADNWLHIRGDPLGAHAATIKRQIRAAFYEETETWQEAVVTRALAVVAAALKGLAND